MVVDLSSHCIASLYCEREREGEEFLFLFSFFFSPIGQACQILWRDFEELGLGQMITRHDTRLRRTGMLAAIPLRFQLFCERSHYISLAI